MINWRSIISQQIKYSSQYDCIRIGYPSKVSDSPVYIHCAFVHPGCHSIIIHHEGKFYKKDHIIRYRSDEPNPYVAPSVDLLSPVSPVLPKGDTKSKRDINSIKLAMPENSMIKSKNVTMNLQ